MRHAAGTQCCGGACMTAWYLLLSVCCFTHIVCYRVNIPITQTIYVRLGYTYICSERAAKSSSWCFTGSTLLRAPWVLDRSNKPFAYTSGFIKVREKWADRSTAHSFFLNVAAPSHAYARLPQQRRPSPCSKTFGIFLEVLKRALLAGYNVKAGCKHYVACYTACISYFQESYNGIW